MENLRAEEPSVHTWLLRLGERGGGGLSPLPEGAKPISPMAAFAGSI